MFFTVKPITNNFIIDRAMIIQTARRTILLAKPGVAEQRLDAYIKKQYKTTLKLLCLNLLGHCKIMQNANDEIIITFVDKKMDKIAAFITYGDGHLQGSNLLTTAFSRAIR